MNKVNSGKVIEKYSSMEFGTRFLFARVNLAIAKLWHTFSTTPILHHFDPKYHIWIVINTLCHAIGKILT